MKPLIFHSKVAEPWLFPDTFQKVHCLCDPVVYEGAQNHSLGLDRASCHNSCEGKGASGRSEDRNTPEVGRTKSHAFSNASLKRHMFKSVMRNIVCCRSDTVACGQWAGVMDWLEACSVEEFCRIMVTFRKDFPAEPVKPHGSCHFVASHGVRLAHGAEVGAKLSILRLVMSSSKHSACFFR